MNQEMTIFNIGKEQVIEELFNAELQKVKNNISDLTTSATTKREIILKISFKPDKEREKIETDVSVSSKLCPIEPFKTNLYRNNKNGSLYIRDDSQLEIGD
jgi:hypothetical protein